MLSTTNGKHPLEAFTSWSNYVSLGGTITGNPAVTRNSDGRLEVFVVGANGNALYHKWQTAPAAPPGQHGHHLVAQ